MSLERANLLPPLALLTAFQHVDSSFPSGGFAFSQGLEGLTAVDGRKPGSEEVLAFLGEQIRHRWAHADRVALTLAFRAGEDHERVEAIDRDLDRSTFCQSLRDGATRNGQALLSTHVRLQTLGADQYRASINAGRTPGTLAAVQGFVWRAVGLDEPTAVLLSGYGLVSASLACAVRLGLVGAIGAQALIAELLGTVAACSAEPVEDDAEITGFSPFTEIAAMRQATLPLRLFSN